MYVRETPLDCTNKHKLRYNDCKLLAHASQGNAPKAVLLDDFAI